jgi:hypothetical protein
MKVTSKVLNNAPLILLRGMAVLLIRLGRRDVYEKHLLLKELLQKGKLIETLVVEEGREKRVGIHDHFQFTFRVLPTCTSFKIAFSHVVHWTNRYLPYRGNGALRQILTTHLSTPTAGRCGSNHCHHQERVFRFSSHMALHRSTNI